MKNIVDNGAAFGGAISVPEDGVDARTAASLYPAFQALGNRTAYLLGLFDTLDASKLTAGTVPLARLAGITGAQLADGAITITKLADNTVSTAKIQDGAVTAAKLDASAKVAHGLKTATTTVAIDGAAAPAVGQVLTATSGTAAEWQTLPAGISLSNATPSAVAGSASAGVGSKAAREDHSHGAAQDLKTATGVVSVSGAAAPTPGQVLTAISGTEAEWQTPAAIPDAIPTGAIIIWKGNTCPAGWIRDDDFASLFLMGAPAGQNPGGTGGSATHSHDIGGHTHSFSGSTGYVEYHGNGSTFVTSASSSTSASHRHGFSGNTDAAVGDTAAASTLPPYRTVLFCRKV